MRIEQLEDLRAGQWDDYVDSCPNGTIFHRVAWRDVIRKSTGHRPYFLAALEGESVCGVLPLFLLNTGIFGKMAVSLPFLNVGGIISDSPEAEKALADESAAYAQKAGLRYVELRQRYPTQLDLPVSDRKVVSIFPLSGGPEAVYSRLHQNVRNKIRKAEKNEVIIEKGAGGLRDFYSVYARNLRDLGTPVISYNFFQCIVDAFPDEAEVYVARRRGEVIGAKLVLFDHQTCYFVWAAARRDRMKYAPVQALNWAAIQDACKNECVEIDMGRSTRDSSQQSFKKYWGVEVHPLPWTYQLIGDSAMPGLNPDNPKFALAVRTWRRLPVCLTRLIGPSLARRLP
jgi:FemAB-related protein (PEP-CTERM system-associated)